MYVILTDNIRNLGKLGERVKVRGGYARNYLIPYGKAVFATPANMAVFEARREELEQQAAHRLADAQRRAQLLAEKGPVEIAAKSADEGKLYGSVGARDIAMALSNAGVAVERQEVLLPEGPFRHTGDYTVDLQLHSEVTATAYIRIVPLPN